MKGFQNPKNRSFEGSANYRIKFRGTINPKWIDRLGEMKISKFGEHFETTLVGPVRDQAELNGVLDTLYSLHLTILSVERIEGNDSSDISTKRKSNNVPTRKVL
jgi:hypothetical protein